MLPRLAILLTCLCDVVLSAGAVLLDSQIRLEHSTTTLNHDQWLQHVVQPVDWRGTAVSLIHRRVLEELERTLDVLQDVWFDLATGRWPDSIDWTGAVINTHLVAALETLSRASHDGVLTSDGCADRISSYFAQSSAYYFGEHAASLKKQAYDDMLWVVLSWLETIKFINGHSSRKCNDSSWHGVQFRSVFARRAAVFYNITTHGWSTDLCDGGMTWNPALPPYKNAITNELFIAGSIGMYLYSPADRWRLSSSSKALDAAVRGHEWLMRSNITNSQGLVVDGYHISGYRNSTKCDSRNEMVYTYNQGVVLSGLKGLWQASGNTTYLSLGHRYVRDTIRATGWHLNDRNHANDTTWKGLGRDGIIEDYCDASASCDQNAHTFKSIYFHHLGLFCQLTQEEPSWHRRDCSRYIAWVAHNAHAALKSRDLRGRVGSWWSAPHLGNMSTSAPLPLGAVDYRNHPCPAGEVQASKLTPYCAAGQHIRRSSPHHGFDSTDIQDRGRGRTVESHSGGVAVLRCLAELLHAAGGADKNVY